MEEQGYVRLLVIGSTGLLGGMLTQKAAAEGVETIGTYLSNKPNATVAGTCVRLDVTDRRAVQEAFEKLMPDAAVNCAAMTDVDLCEREKGLAASVNSEAAGYLAEASKAIGTHLVQVSTDYVFDGAKGMYSEDDEANPINYYGTSKLEGERRVSSLAGGWCIARTSVVFGWGREKRPNYATWLIRGLREGKRLSIVTDQVSSPTLNTNLAEMLLEAAQRRLRGTYHLAGRDRVDRYTMATHLADCFSLDKRLLSPVSSASMSWLAKRPMDSSLNVGKAMRTLARKPLRLDEALSIMRSSEEQRMMKTAKEEDPP
jgi:dTDP-4-dehydrorhamnose reductase